jgi:hypothetical protein
MFLIAMALSAASVDADPAAKTPTRAKADKLQCKNKPATGTRFPSKTCRTAEQWEMIAEQNRRAAGEMVDRPALNPPGD